ncbi:MAG: hypothetical protein AAFR75_10695, partial [Pseudomonadota bacterium]
SQKPDAPDPLLAQAAICPKNPDVTQTEQRKLELQGFPQQVSHFLEVYAEVSEANPNLVAKEFGDRGLMDDSSAFEEQSSPSSVAGGSTKAWRPAAALTKLKEQIDVLYPGRSKASDGFIGDSAHCPGASDHCPNIDLNGVGIVAAFDCTHDPANGCDLHVITNAIIKSRDARIKYIIFDSRICSSYEVDGHQEWEWRPYSGSNPHDRHAHFSVLSDVSKFDDVTAWQVRLQPSRRQFELVG